MDILEQLQRVLDATPEHQYLAAQPISRRQLVAIVTELRRLRAAVAAAEAQTPTSHQPNQ